MQVTYGKGFYLSPIASMRARVERLESALLTVPQVDCPIRNHFAPGVYAREISIPKGTVLVGAIHRMDNLVIVSKGRLQLVTEDGTKEVAAGETLLCKAGAKNAAVALEDTTWTNVFANPDDEQDTAVLVERYTFSTEADLLGGDTNQQLAANKAAEITEA